MKNHNYSMTIKRLLRKAVNARSNCPINIVAGWEPPTLKGECGHWTNKRGDKINNIGAYLSAWGKPVYHHSSIRVEVGAEWLINHMTDLNLKMLKLAAFK